MSFSKRIRRGAAVGGLTIAMLATATPAGAVDDQSGVDVPATGQSGVGAGSFETTYPATLEYSFTLDEIVDDIGAGQLHAAGVTGEGVTIAVIDTGVADVPGLDAPGKVIHGPDLSFEAGVPELYSRDSYGHGTVMASIIAGDDGVEGGFRGVAPGARILSVKVADNTGAVDVSQVIAAIDFVIDTQADTGARVINLSYQGAGRADIRTDPLIAAVERAWAAGIVVVVSAGNDGNGTSSLGNPAQSPWVIAVAASAEALDAEADGTIGLVASDFSNSGSDRRHPDITAPGERVLGLVAPGSRLATEHPQAVIEGRYLRGSGTSQAAAVVSGAAALLLQAHPSMTPDEVKAALMLGADDTEDRELSMIEASPKVAAAAANVDRAIDAVDRAVAKVERREAELAEQAEQLASTRSDLALRRGELATALVALEASSDDASSKDVARAERSVEHAERRVTRGEAAVAATEARITRATERLERALGAVEEKTATLERRQAQLGRRLDVEGRKWSGSSIAGIRLHRVTGAGWLDVTRAASLDVDGMAQDHKRSDGSGSLDDARGGVFVTLPDGSLLQGDVTFAGASWTGGSWTGGSWTGGSWTGGSWTGGSWTGGSWTGGSWTGDVWEGATWSGATWTGGSWTGGSWTGGSWSADVWEGASWSGGSWTGGSWTGATWTGGSWSGGSWTGATWTGATWTNAGWAAIAWG